MNNVILMEKIRRPTRQKNYDGESDFPEKGHRGIKRGLGYQIRSPIVYMAGGEIAIAIRCDEGEI